MFFFLLRCNRFLFFLMCARKDEEIHAENNSRLACAVWRHEAQLVPFVYKRLDNSYMPDYKKYRMAKCEFTVTRERTWA